MVLLLGIIVGGLFAWLAVRIGFYETWAMLINVVAAVYVAVFSAQASVDYFPGADHTPCANALMLVAIAIAAFFILHGISYTFLTGQFNISFPKIFDTVLAGVLGFLVGFFILSFAVSAFLVTPISQHKSIPQGLSRESLQVNVRYMCRACDTVSWLCDGISQLASSPSDSVKCEQILDELANSARAKGPRGTAGQDDPNIPGGSG